MANKLSPDMLDPRNNLQLYTRDVIKNADIWTEKLLRSEYSRLRDIAQKRLARLAVEEPESYAYRTNVGQYPTARGTSTQEIMKLLPDLAKFIAAKTGTVRGIREARQKALETLQQTNHDFITRENIREFQDFMAAWRASDNGKRQTWGSDEVVQMFRWHYEQGISLERVRDNFKHYMRAQKQLETYAKKQSERGEEVTSDMILAEFKRVEKQREARNTRARERYAEKKKSKMR